MGCCNSGEVETARDSFDQAWQVFKATDLAKPDRFSQNRQRVFRFLFLSIVLPQTQQTRDRVATFAQKLPKNSGVLGEVRREIVRLDEELVNLEQQRKVLHQDFLKRIKSDMPSYDEPSKLPVRDQREEEKSQQPDRGSLAGPSQGDPVLPVLQSVSEMHQSHIRSSFEAYSIPLTVMDSLLDRQPLDEERPKADSNYSRNERLLEALEFESDRRKALEVQVQALDCQVEQQRAELLRLEGTRIALLDELRGKQEAIEQMRKETTSERLQEEAIEARRDKQQLEERVAEMQLQLEQFKGEVARLDRERDEALRENKYLSGKVKDLGDTLCHTTNEDSVNVSLSILPHLAPPRKPALALACVIQQRVEPSSRISEHNKMDRSFIMVEQEGEGEGTAEQLNGYSILFNLFPHSRVLPSHSDFQAAVGTRTIIADLFDRRPLRSELIFAFDPITPNHFARYIDGRENLLLLVALPNGLTIGGFAGNFVGDNELSDSFLFSLDPHREPMKLTPVPSRRVRRIDLDPGQLVFGNGELRVRAKTLEVSSSAGCFQSLYCWGRRAVPVEKFLGTSERTLMANAYEIHQLHFA